MTTPYERRVAERAEARRQKTKTQEQPYEGKCVECRKKRTICIHVRRTGNMGHVSITLGDGTNFTAYGNWPAKTKGADTVQRHSSEDPASAPNNPERDKRYEANHRKCREMTEEQEKKFKDYANNPGTYALRNNNCSTWASGAWAAAGGNPANFGWGTYHTPGDVLSSMPNL